ncbi:MAG: HlyC/CorC family transporter [Gammaproteobacteria bacterium]|nr:HlyC/CorC family transporter [Gammaproteobacteria bacterium]
MTRSFHTRVHPSLDDVPIGALLGVLILLISLSAFFSASETGMMALNRYRLKHLAESGHRGARIAERLLQHPDRLLGTILLGNNLVNNAAAVVTSVLALKLYGEVALAVAAFLITLVILVFAEVPPKTLAALHPERVAFPAAFVLHAIQKVAYPLVWLVNVLSNGVLRLFGVHLYRAGEQLGAEELRTVVKEASTMIPRSHQSMLLRILDLEEITVDDVLIPRAEIEAIDIDDDWEDIVIQLGTSHHTRLPVYQGTLDNVIGVLHLRKALHLIQRNEFDKESLKRIMREPYFIPEGSALTQQLLALQSKRRRFGLVVDEYGDLKGLVTIEEILEEIVGEFTGHVPGIAEDVHVEKDGSYLVKGNANIRDLNRKMGWELPTDGPKTLNGLILEYLEDIPEPGTRLQLAGYPVEVVQTKGTAVTVSRLRDREQARVEQAVEAS